MSHGSYVTACHTSTMCPASVPCHEELRPRASELAECFQAWPRPNPSQIPSLIACDGSESHSGDSASNQSLLVEFQCLLRHAAGAKTRPKVCSMEKYGELLNYLLRRHIVLVWDHTQQAWIFPSGAAWITLRNQMRYDVIGPNRNLQCWPSKHTSFSFHLGHFAEGGSLLESGSNQQMKSQH